MSDRYVPAAGRAVFTPIYDAVNALTMRQGLWRPCLVERAVGSADSIRILDLGCGTGAIALAIARASPGVTVIGVDGDPDVLERAHEKAQAEGITLELHQALADRLPVPDASVDCVVSTLVFHHLAPSMKRAALAEARRVLVPGGRLLICDIGRASDPVCAPRSLPCSSSTGSPTHASTHAASSRDRVARRLLERHRDRPIPNRRRHARTAPGTAPRTVGGMNGRPA